MQEISYLRIHEGRSDERTMTVREFTGEYGVVFDIHGGALDHDDGYFVMTNEQVSRLVNQLNDYLRSRGGNTALPQWVEHV